MVVDITANHQGYFTFKLCPNNDIWQDPKQVKRSVKLSLVLSISLSFIFDVFRTVSTGMMTGPWLCVVVIDVVRFVLPTGKAASEKYYISDYITGMRLVYVHLPPRVSCDQCILQWTYTAGNNWGVCSNGENIKKSSKIFWHGSLSRHWVSRLWSPGTPVRLKISGTQGNFIF